MKNISLGGDENWPEVSVVSIDPDPSARPWQKEGEAEVIESWQRVAVFRVEPRSPYVVGFIAADGTIKWHRRAIEHSVFGMRVGREPVRFFILPILLTGQAHPKLELVKITRLDDPKYPDLPLY